MPLRWIGAFTAALVAIAAFAIFKDKAVQQESDNFRIGSALYQWPRGATIIPPQPRGIYGKGYVRYSSSSSYPDKNAYLIVYDGNAQEARNEAGLPHLQQVTGRFAERADYSFHKTAFGTVVCNRKSVQVGTAFPCGLSFMHLEARWQLLFGAHRVPEAEQIYEEAVRRLEVFRGRE